jgi:hypothetical protein
VAATAFVNKLAPDDTHVNLTPDISVYADDNVPHDDTKTDLFP